MKKLFTFLTMMMAVTTTTLFTSCDTRFWVDDEDREEARTLEGTWSGYIDTYFYDRFGVSGDTYRTTMYFERENGYGGWGYEVDYNIYSRYDDYYYCEFRWEVINGAIRIRYADSWNDVYIYDYVLDDYYFSGYMDDGCRDREVAFTLNYDSNFDWGYWTRGFTRGLSEKGTGFKASGEFAK
jgi:hypothetical protein